MCVVYVRRVVLCVVYRVCQEFVYVTNVAIWYMKVETLALTRYSELLSE